ncbi:SEFIR domain-containing protein [Mucilaginibacter sp. AW1-3]
MQPKVFISYSWSSPDHEDWVITLAQRLVNDGVDVSIDKWDLKEGQDKYRFMESMVSSVDIHKVLLILDKKYASKANDRDGGVGTETQIISPQIYENTSQEKFIPIVAELDEEGKPYIPTYLNGRIYLDMSSSEHSESNYEKLLRNILNRPLLAKPKLGKVPSYIFEDTPINFKTTALVRGFDSQLDRFPNRGNSISRDFFDAFFDNLKDFRISSISNLRIDAGKQILENLHQYTPLRDDFIDFIVKISNGNFEFDTDILIRFFEQLPSLFYPEESVGSWSNHQFDNFRFIVHELLIYTVAIFLKNENYKFLEDIFYNGYFIKDRYSSKNEPSNYTTFYKNVDTFSEYYNQLKGQNFYSAQADFMISRISNKLDRTTFTNGDLLCFYIGLFQKNHWFPLTYVYREEDNRIFPFFNKLISKRHFEKVKGLFDVNTPIELIEKLNLFQSEESNNMRYSGSWSSVPNISRLIDAEKVATLR